MHRSKADPIHIQQLTFNEESKAVRVDLVPTQMNVALTHTDGDSVYTVKRMTVVDAKVGDIINCEEVETICRLTGTIENVHVYLGPEDLLIDALKLQKAVPTIICVPAIQVKEDCILVLRG